MGARNRHGEGGMKLRHTFAGWMLSLALLGAAHAAPALDLRGYADDTGAITILHGGDATDPYFAMQALLLAHDNGMDISAVAEKFANWLVPRQKPDGTFDRFCRGADKKWVSCKTADADDSLLAIWMRLLETMPAQLNKNPVWMKSYQISKKSLDHLYQPSRGVYMVSPVYLHGLFMDNLEVWSLKAHTKQPAQVAEAEKLAKAIHATFWEPVNKRFLVSTQLEQRSQKPAFYPDHVAQIFPLLVGFPLLPAEAGPYYRNWMRMHRADWLGQSETDYPWGLLAVLALRQNDKASASCWLREAAPLRHSARWAVSDEAAYQIVVGKGLTAAAKGMDCL
jgi:hypothetical protein